MNYPRNPILFADIAHEFGIFNSPVHEMIAQVMLADISKVFKVAGVGEVRRDSRAKRPTLRARSG